MDVIVLTMMRLALWGTPVAVSICWWIWFRRGVKSLPQWRMLFLLIGLIAISANALIYYAWVYYSQVTYETSASSLEPSIVRGTLGNNVAVPLVTLHSLAQSSERGQPVRCLPCLR